MTDEDVRAVVRALKASQATEFEALADQLGAMETRLLSAVREVSRRVTSLEDHRDEVTDHLHGAEAGWVNAYRDLAARVSALEERER